MRGAFRRRVVACPRPGPPRDLGQAASLASVADGEGREGAPEEGLGSCAGVQLDGGAAREGSARPLAPWVRPRPRGSQAAVV